jgi:chitodextrinase
MSLLMVAAGLLTATANGATVRDFGATGNGSTDDTAAIQNAINSTPSGGVLGFPAGTYRVTSTLHLKSGVTYQGSGSPVLLGYLGTGPYGYLLADGSDASNVTITGIVFNGGGISFAQGGWTSNITITGNTFKNITGLGPNAEPLHAGVYVDHVSNISISNSTFSNIIDGGAPTVYSSQGPMANGVKAYHASHFTIADNTMDYMGQGISMSQISPSDPCDCTDIKFLRNRFTRVFRMAIEIQGGLSDHPLTGLVIDSNVATNWLNPYADTFGISHAAYSTNAVISNNFFDANPAASNASGWQRYGYCLEVDGDSTLVQGNTCVSSNNPQSWAWNMAGPQVWPVAIAGRSVKIQNNTICGGAAGIFYEPPYPNQAGYPATISGNSYPPCGQVVNPPGTTPQPPAAPSVPTGLSAVAASSSQINLHWTASTGGSGVAGYKLFRNGTQVGTSTSTSYSDTGLAAATAYSYTAAAYDGSGNTSAQSGSVSATTMAPVVTGLQSDEFNASTLNSGMWNFIDPMNNDKVALNGKQALITVAGGSTHDAWSGGNMSARIMQPASNTDFQIEIKLDTVVKSAYQSEGILVQQDSNNWLRLDLTYEGGSTPTLFAATFANGTPTVRMETPWTVGAGPVWLRLKRTGNNWTASVSTDGVNYTVATQFAFTTKVAFAGVFAGNYNDVAANAPGFTAAFDYFRVN